MAGEKPLPSEIVRYLESREGFVAKRDSDELSSLGLLRVTDKRGSISDPLRPIAQILRASTHSKILARSEIIDILRSEGIERADAYRLFGGLKRGKYLEEF